jgi:hypothetical protein
MAMRKEVVELLNQLEAQGFTWRKTGKGHAFVTAPDGSPVTTISGTPSDGHSIPNALSQLRRAGFVPPAKGKRKR